jgi:hypothetical protein
MCEWVRAAVKTNPKKFQAPKTKNQLLVYVKPPRPAYCRQGFEVSRRSKFQKPKSQIPISRIMISNAFRSIIFSFPPWILAFGIWDFGLWT